MFVKLLNKKQLTELKQFDYCNDVPDASYGELARIDKLISDDEIIEKYYNTMFVTEDFNYRMSENQEKFFVENKDIYIREFVDYFTKTYDFAPDDFEIELAFKDYMYYDKNIDWLDFGNDLVNQVVNEICNQINTIMRDRIDQKREEELERKLNRSIDDEY